MAASFVAQVYSCIYYSIFWHRTRADRRRPHLDVAAEKRMVLLRSIAPAAVAALAVWRRVAAYFNRATLGERLDRDILLYSATWPNYLATTENVVHGEWSSGHTERFLFPGALTSVDGRAFWRMIVVERRWWRWEASRSSFRWD